MHLWEILPTKSLGGGSMELKTERVLILREVELHPHSVLSKIEGAFERPSIIHVVTRDAMRQYTKHPIFDDKYLAIFDSVKIFEANIPTLKLDVVFPVVHCTSRSASDDAKLLCQEKGLPFSMYFNPFEKSDAYDMVRDLASEKVTEEFCKTLVKRVGLHPKRIVSAVMVCDQVGYTTASLSRYVDKNIYIDIYDVIESLLGICRSGAQVKRAGLYVHMNRVWYTSHTRTRLVKEVDTLLKIYRDFLSGVVTSFSIHDYVDSAHVSRYRVLYTRDLMERVSLTELMTLRYFLETATALEVAMRLS